MLHQEFQQDLDQVILLELILDLNLNFSCTYLIIKKRRGLLKASFFLIMSYKLFKYNIIPFLMSDEVSDKLGV